MPLAHSAETGVAPGSNMLAGFNLVAQVVAQLVPMGTMEPMINGDEEDEQEDEAEEQESSAKWSGGAERAVPATQPGKLLAIAKRVVATDEMGGSDY